MELIVRGLAFKSGARSDAGELSVTLLRELHGPDRPDYWLGALSQPVHWVSEAGGSFEVTHIVLASQWEGTRVRAGVTRLPVGIAYVLDPSLLDDEQLDVSKISYVATGVADDADSGRSESPTSTVARVTARLFGKRPQE